MTYFLNDSRLRVLINIESHIALFLAAPESFEPNLAAFADIFKYCHRSRR